MHGIRVRMIALPLLYIFPHLMKTLFPDTSRFSSESLFSAMVDKLMLLLR